MPNRSTGAPTLQSVPTDLVLIAVLGFLTATGLVGTVESLLGLSVAFVAILFAPGYALVTALFPTAQSRDGQFDGTALGGRRITAIERLVLAVGMSVCFVPLLGIGLTFTAADVRPQLLVVIGISTVAFSIIAVVRRFAVDASERFNPRILGAGWDAVNRFERARSESTLTLLLLLGFVVAAAGLGAAVMTAENGEQFTEFYLTTQEPGSAEDTAGGYPDRIEQGSSESVQVGVTNNEGESMEYTVVVLLQSFGDTGSDDVAQVGVTDVFTMRVPQGETVTRIHSIEPSIPADEIRVTYLLYRGDLPADDEYQPDNAYRTVHFWADVTPASAE